jgi:O-acetylhomoserine/O-acetylserine sulfhydrylase-like pyridoxal-dependent enzyme
LKIHSKAVHAGDRKKPSTAIPVTTPIHTASSYFYDSIERLDRVFERTEPGYCYSRYDNPTNAALEELMCALEGGEGSLACASGMPCSPRWPTGANPSWPPTPSMAQPSGCC